MSEMNSPKVEQAPNYFNSKDWPEDVAKYLERHLTYHREDIERLFKPFDREVFLTATNFSVGASGAASTRIGNFPGWGFSINDDMYTSFEVPEDWDDDTKIEVELYWGIDEAYAADDGEVQWLVTWAACPSDETEALDSPTHTGSIDFGDQNIPATAKHLTKSEGEIAAASLAAGDMVGMNVKRVALDDGNDPTAEPVLVNIEIHYTSNRVWE